MAAGSAGASAGAAAAAAIARAIKASGAIVRVEPKDFEGLVGGMRGPLVLHQEPGGMFSRDHRYATSFHGFVFVTVTREAVYLPADAVVMPVKKIWLPD